MFHSAITIILDDRRDVHLFDHLGIALLYHFEAFMLANHASKLMTASVPLYLLNDRREIDFLEYLGIAPICTVRRHMHQSNQRRGWLWGWAYTY